VQRCEEGGCTENEGERRRTEEEGGEVEGGSRMKATRRWVVDVEERKDNNIH